MALINCAGCHEAIDISDELLGDMKPDEVEYYCESCDSDEGEDFDDGEPDYTLDEWEWQERYPELVDDEILDEPEEQEGQSEKGLLVEFDEYDKEIERRELETDTDPSGSSYFFVQELFLPKECTRYEIRLPDYPKTIVVYR